MENPKALAIARIKEANNVLVTVSANPSVDQLAGAIGLTLVLNKLGKHATAVFSGDVPSTIEFLQPEATLEKNTDSLRDFIIALDKAKADKLRYKVEDRLVKIFITPYKTSIDQEDLEFSHGDFNVDVVVALGVHEQQDLDQAITAHGRILHDAAIMSINTRTAGNLGTVNWVDEQASSLCEMLADLGVTLKADVLDAQMATALMTGIVAETDRFSNEKTTSVTMSISAKLMAAGANQQLVATKLQESHEAPQSLSVQPPHEPGEPKDVPEDNGANKNGALQIDHPSDDDDEGDQDGDNQPPADDQSPPVGNPSNDTKERNSILPDTPRIILEPPSMGGAMSAVSMPSNDDPTIDPLSLPPVDPPILSHDNEPAAPADEPAPSQSEEPPVTEPAPASPPAPLQAEPQTLEDIEHAVESPHIEDEPASTADAPKPDGTSTADLDKARDAVTEAVASGPEEETLEPIAALGAQPVDLDFGHDEESASPEPTPPQAPEQHKEDYFDITKLDEATGLPSNLVPPTEGLPTDTTAASVENPTAPPPVPPPLMPPAMPPMTSGEQPLPNAEDDNQAQEPLAPL